MATRRARIKAIVNVPARRTKANEESANSKIANLSNVREVDKVRSSPSEKNYSSPILDVNIKECTTEEKSKAESPFSSSTDNFESICIKRDAENVSKENDLDASNTSADADDGLQNISNIIHNDSKKKKEDELNTVVKSGLDETTSGTSANKVEVNEGKNKEAGPLNSPLKQRPRLFIRPSPKLVDSSGRRRFPSGNRPKSSSESEEETRTRCVTEDSEPQVAESINCAPNSLQERSSKSQEEVETNSNEASGDTKKPGSRAGRQRAKNKENRASNFRRRFLQQMKKKNGSAPLDRTRLTMFDYIYYNPVSNPMRSSSESSVSQKEKEEEKIVDNERGNALSEEQVDDPGEGGSLLHSQNAQAEQEDEMDDGGLPAPRVKVGPDGELILDEQSLVIETTGLKEGLKDLAKGPALVESSSFTNYATYSKRTKGHEWSENETLRFYRALNVVGTDFTLMQSLLFGKRSRRDLKNKFKREERRNPSLIEKALRYPGYFSNAEELQSEFAKNDPPEQEKTEGKKGKGRSKARGGKRAAPKSSQSPAKKRNGKYWLVDGNVSQGEDMEDDGSVVGEPSKPVSTPVEKPTESGHTLPPDVIYSVSSDEVMMASQEIVLTNEDSPPSSSRGGRRNAPDSEGDSDDSESTSRESQFLSRVLQPTRSGRIPKRREVNNGYQVSHKNGNESHRNVNEDKQRQGEVKAEVRNTSSEPVRQEMRTEEIVCSNVPLETNSAEDSRPSVSIEVRDCSAGLPSDMERISGMEPGSLVVIATTAPDDPSRKVLEVFMVSPMVGGQDSLLIPHNLSTSERIQVINGENEEILVSSVESSERAAATSVVYPQEKV